MARTRIYRLLEGYRGQAPADLDAIARDAGQVSQLVIDIAEIEELDINPLLADAAGVIALDARIRVAAASGAPTQRLAIRPYPKELEETIRSRDGRELILRPILPEDEPAFQRGMAQLTPEEIRLRFFTPIKALHAPAERRASRRSTTTARWRWCWRSLRCRARPRCSASPGSRRIPTTSVPSTRSSCATT